MDLSDEHKRMLAEDSGISEEVINARGYRTAYKKAQLEELGFGRSERRVPALVIPAFSPTGEIANYQIRPDNPRVDNAGRVVKYETPGGSRMVLDVHPFAQEMLGDPKVALFITEGIKKGDALVSRRLCAVALLGVWNWRGRNEHGGLTALPEWEYLALNDGRRVHIVFDSDIVLKPEVYTAMLRLKNFLEDR